MSVLRLGPVMTVICEGLFLAYLRFTVWKAVRIPGTIWSVVAYTKRMSGQKDVGQGVGLARLRHGVREDDATRLRHQTLATRQADKFLLGLTLFAIRERNAIFAQHLLHLRAGAPYRFPTIFGCKLPDALGKLGLALQIDEYAAMFLEILHKGDGCAVFFLDGHPGLSAFVDVLKQGLLPFDEGIAHLGEHLFLEGGVLVFSFVVPSHGV